MQKGKKKQEPSFADRFFAGFQPADKQKEYAEQRMKKRLAEEEEEKRREKYRQS